MLTCGDGVIFHRLYAWTFSRLQNFRTPNMCTFILEYVVLCAMDFLLLVCSNLQPLRVLQLEFSVENLSLATREASGGHGLGPSTTSRDRIEKSYGLYIIQVVQGGRAAFRVWTYHAHRRSSKHGCTENDSKSSHDRAAGAKTNEEDE